jgi:hypothetical protein
VLFVKRKTVALFCRVSWCYFCRCETGVTTVEDRVLLVNRMRVALICSVERCYTSVDVRVVLLP